MPYWSRGKLVSLAKMPKPHLVNAFKRFMAGSYRPPEGVGTDGLEAEFLEEFAVRMMDPDGRKWDENEGGG